MSLHTPAGSWSQSFDGQQNHKMKKRRRMVTSFVKRKACQGDHITKLCDLWDGALKSEAMAVFSLFCLIDGCLMSHRWLTRPLVLPGEAFSSVCWFIFDLCTVKTVQWNQPCITRLPQWFNMFVSFMSGQLNVYKGGILEFITMSLIIALMCLLFRIWNTDLWR